MVVKTPTPSTSQESQILEAIDFPTPHPRERKTDDTKESPESKRITSLKNVLQKHSK